MAAEQEPTSRTHRLLALGAVGFLAAATAIAFGRVFIGHGATWKLLAAGLASVAVAGLLERRSLLLATLVSAACLLIALGLLVFPETTWLGLPTKETLRAIGDSLGLIREQARVQVAPTPPLPPLMLAAVTATWTAAFSAHALAIRAGSPILAVLPPIALVGFSDTVMEDGARPGYAVLLLCAVLLVVFADGLRRIRQWGPVWGRAHTERSLVAGHGARRVAAIAVAAAVLIPGILPGFRSGPLLDLSTSPGNQVHIDPFVSIQAQLQRRDPVDLFRVTSMNGDGQPQPAYWRLYALDSFDGTTWRSSDPDATNGQVIDSPALLSAPTIAGTAVVVDQQYRVLTDLADRWVPMAYPPEILNVPFGSVRFDGDLTAALSPETLGQGLQYTVRSRLVSPTPEQLDQVSFSTTVPGRYTSVPSSVPAKVSEIAQTWSAGASTPYRKVLAIMDHFTAPGAYHYSLDVKPRADTNALVDFLTKNKTGFCQQFATAMAILVRELGIPARVAVGFRPGAQSGNTFTVSTEDAHSWVEVLFPGYGWLPFEPTPGGWHSPLATPGSYLSPTIPGTCPPSQPGCAGGTETNTSGGVTGGPLTGKLQQVELGIRQQGGGHRGGHGGGSGVPLGGYSIPYGRILLILIVLALVLLIAIPVAKTVWRRRLVRSARDPSELVLRAYRVFDGEAADVGFGRKQGETLTEHGDRLSDAIRFSDGHLGRLTRAATRAAYSTERPSRAEARDIVRDARTAIRDVRAEAGLLRRLRGIYRPGV
jgi:transglutaminase-like putative cysteine protease